VNFTDDTFPPLESAKKTKTNDTVATEPTNSIDDTPSFTTVDLDEIDAKREELRAEMKAELEQMRQDMAKLRQEMRTDFMLQVGQMELRIEKNMKPMITDFNDRFQTIMHQIQTVSETANINAHANAEKFDRIMEAIATLTKRSLPTPNGTPVRNTEKRIRGQNDTPTDLMPIDHPSYEADGSLPTNPQASRAITPTAGKTAPAGATK
jgi:hypothetical protein